MPPAMGPTVSGVWVATVVTQVRDVPDRLVLAVAANV